MFTCALAQADYQQMPHNRSKMEAGDSTECTGKRRKCAMCCTIARCSLANDWQSCKMPLLVSTVFALS